MNIDTTRLTRDYTEQPLGKLEKPAKKDLEYLFKELSMTVEDLTKYFNKGKSSVGRWLTKYDIKKGTPQTKYVNLTQDEINSVDLTRMSRDFQTKPWVPHKDIPVESDFRYLYIELNWSGEAIATYLGVSTSQVRVFLRNFGITKDSSLKAEVKEKELQRKYGVSHVSHIEGVKEKKEQTCLKNHGVKYILEKEEVREGRMEEIYGNKHALCVPELKKKQEDSLEKTTGYRHLSELQELAKEGVMKKYGVDNVFKLPEFQEKAKKTRIARYGNHIPMRVPESIMKFKKTMLMKHAVEFPLQHPDFVRKSQETCMKNHKCLAVLDREKIAQVLIQSYGVSNPSLIHIKHRDQITKEFWLENFIDIRNNAFDTAKCALYHGIQINTVKKYKKQLGITIRCKGTSIQETKLMQLLEQLGGTPIKNDRALISPLELDVVDLKNRIAIEYDGIMYHSQGLSSLMVSEDYHLRKTEHCMNKGIQLFHIFETEWLSASKRPVWEAILQRSTNSAQIIDVDLMHIRQIDSLTAKNFVNENSLSTLGVTKINYGLFYEEQLVATLSVDNNGDNGWVLSQYAMLNGFNIPGGLNKLSDFFRDTYQGPITAYANRRWDSGVDFENAGFKQVAVEAPQPLFYKVRPDGISPQTLLLYTMDDIENIMCSSDFSLDSSKSICENMYQNGYRSIYDCGNLVYVLK